MFTAAGKLQLVEKGALALDAPIGTYLKDYPNAAFAKTVTIRQFLSHTGGAGDIIHARAIKPVSHEHLAGTGKNLQALGIVLQRRNIAVRAAFSDVWVRQDCQQFRICNLGHCFLTGAGRQKFDRTVRFSLELAERLRYVKRN